MQKVLDPDATPFTRIWCCFEQAMVAQGRKLKLDMATVCDVPEKKYVNHTLVETGKTLRDSVLLTDGPANQVEKCSRSFFGIGSAQNSDCESDAHCGHTLDQDT